MSDSNKRNFKNYLINPSFQLRISVYFSIAAFAATSFVMFVFYKKFTAIRTLLVGTSDIPVSIQMAVDGIMYDFMRISMFSFLIMILGIVVVGVLVTHRIAGPMYAILAFIEDLKRGNYDSQRNLRPYDELSPIMDSLKELAKTIKK